MSSMPIVLALLLVVLQAIDSCPPNWYGFNQLKCLRYFPVNVPYSGAESLCRTHNASVASIHSKEEEDFVLGLGRLHYTMSGVHWVWLGAERNASDSRDFHWKDSTSFNYSNWRDGCPDTRLGENCVLMTIFRDRPSHWCNFKCDSNFDHVICQKGWTPDDPIEREELTTLSSTGSGYYPFTRIRRPPPMRSTDECDLGWDFKFNKCYKFIAENVTGEEARYYCRRFGSGAQPLTIRSEAEQSWAVEYSFFTNEAKEAIWLGATRIGPNQKDIAWRDGTDMNYTNWSPHEPDNRNSSENCVAINDMPKWFGRWLDAPCSLKFHLICEKTAKRPLPANVSDEMSYEELINTIQGSVTQSDGEAYGTGSQTRSASSNGLIGFLMFLVVSLATSTGYLGYLVLIQRKEQRQNLRESRVNIYYASEGCPEPEYEEPKYGQSTGSGHLMDDEAYTSGASSVYMSSSIPTTNIRQSKF